MSFVAGGMTKARELAQANADYFGIPYMVFFDTSGNARCERWYAGARMENKEIFQPKNQGREDGIQNP